MNNTIDILAFIKYVLKKSHFVVLCILSGIVVALLVNKMTVVTLYSSETKFYLTSSDETAVSYGALQATSTIMDDYLSMIESKTVVKRAIARNHLKMDEDLVMRMIKASNPSKTHVLVLTVKAQDSKQVEDVTDAISYQIVNYIPSILTGSYLTVFESSGTTMDDGSGKKILNIALSIIIGGLISIIILLVHFITKPTTDNPDAISALSGGVRTHILPLSDRKYFLNDKEKQKKLEKSWELAINELLFDLVFGNDRVRVILLTSPLGAEGRTYVAKRIWQSLQQNGIKVAYVDNHLDEIKPNYLNQIEPDRNDQEQEKHEVSVLAMEQKDLLRVKLDQLKVANEFIIIDAAPVLQNPDSYILAKYSDRVAVVVKYGCTAMQDLKKALQRFAEHELDIHAIVLNQFK